MEKTRTKKTKIMRPLTTSEKVLLTLLGALVLYFVSYKFVFQPQAAKMNALGDQKQDYEAKIVENNRILRNEEQIKKDRMELRKERDGILSKYFPIIDQSQIIYLLEELLAEKKIDISDFRFSRPNIIYLGDREIAKMDINLPFEGKYEDILDVLETIQKSPKRILFSSLNFNRGESTLLSGGIDLNVLSLEGMVSADGDVIYVESIDGNTGNPFAPYGDYKEPQDSSGTGSGRQPETSRPDPSPSPSPSPKPEDKEDSNGKELGQSSILYYFENKTYDFLTDSLALEGFVTPSIIDKSDDIGLKLEFSGEASEVPSRGYIDLSNDNISIEENAASIGINIYSEQAIAGELGFLLKDKKANNIDLLLTDDISWQGWTAKKLDLPEDRSLYPLKLAGIYFEIPENVLTEGDLIFSNLEIINEYFIYEVRPGDTVFDLSIKFYGSAKYMNEILTFNDMKIYDILPVGKILKLKFH